MPFLGLREECCLIQDAADIENFNHIVLPGVGTFPLMMENLYKGGYIGSILNHVNNNKPFMGICLGMQVLFESSEEFTKTQGLSLLKGDVIKLPKGRDSVPNVGWWSLSGDYEVFSKELSERDSFYFVHSYFCRPNEVYQSLTIDLNEQTILAGVRAGNIFGYQFHPEKSQKSGQKLIRSFLDAK